MQKLLIAAGAVLVAAPALAQEAAAAGAATVDPIALVLRWAHVLSAILLLGGSFFIWYALRPAVTEVFGAEGHARLRPALMRRWKYVVHTCILLFLVSGLYNYLVVLRPQTEGNSLYHMLFGIKFLLSLAVFALVSMLISTREKESAVRRNAPLWMGITIALGIVVVLIGGFMMKLR